MKKVPIVFIFNQGYALPASVCIFSLLHNKKEEVNYHICIMYLRGRLSSQTISNITEMVCSYGSCSIEFKEIENHFTNNRTVRYITIDAYCKFEIPKVFEDYERVIYADVDMIFDGDISELMDISFKESIAAVRIPVGHVSIDFKSLNINEENYFNSGLIVMNTRKINENKIIEKKIRPLIGNKYDHVDQDIFNIAFKGDTYFLSSIYNFSSDRLIKDSEERNKSIKVYHYTGAKPWNKGVFPIFSDIWWEYYRRSPFYQENVYFSKQSEYYQLHRYIKLGTKIEKMGVFSLWNILKKIKK